MGYKINFEAYLTNFAIPSTILDDIKNIPSDYIKVILLIFYNQSSEYSVSTLSTLLNLNEQIVLSALRYWNDKKIIKLDEVTLNISAAPVVIANEKVTPAAKPMLSSESTVLLKTIENLYNRPLTSTEINSILSMYQSISLPIDVVMMVFEYCAYVNKLNLNYAQRICIDWMDKGIDTHQKADEHLKSLSDKTTNENKIKSCFGISNRNLTTIEQELISKWFLEYLFSIDIIKYAYEKTINAIGKVSFPYINKILEGYFLSGVKSVADIDGNKAIGKERNNIKSNGKDKSSLDLNEVNKHWSNIPKF